jgi:hypothetical protein
VLLDEVVTEGGGIGLESADITGSLSFSGAKLNGSDKDGLALSASWFKVGEDVFLGKGFTASGAIDLESADITASLSCRGAKLNGRAADGYASIKVGGDVLLDKVVTEGGGIGLESADITGSLSFSGAVLTGRDEDGLRHPAL